MNIEHAIEVRDITKKFKIFFDKGHTLKEKTMFRSRRAYQTRDVLRGISFEVKKGEAIGLIGHNGCGKSTTLKLLTKIMYPDSGTIEMCGRVSSLIELGAGFHPDMSGRENIYINASIFGLTKKEIDERVEDIINFSELEEFIDLPVRTYSSGMYMRLAFSVAINVDAEILLIDEILAVGDAGFQMKCFNRLKEIKASGTTIVIVSHSMGQIEQICDRSIWIHEGKIKAEGKPKEVHPQYLEYIGDHRLAVAEKAEEREKEKQKEESQKEESHKEQQIQDKKTTLTEKKKKRWGNENVTIKNVQLTDSFGQERVCFKTGDFVGIKIDYEMNTIVRDAVVGIGISRIDGVHCYGTNTRIDKVDYFDIVKSGTISFEIESLLLLQGNYVLDVAIECDMGIPVDFYREACKFEVISTLDDVGVSRLQHRWNMELV